MSMCMCLCYIHILFLNHYYYDFSDKRCTQFNEDILKQKDCNDDVISSWCSKGFKPEEGFCTVCNITISCKQHGVSAIKRHAQSKKHVDSCKKIRDASGQLKKQSLQTRLDFSQKNSKQLSHSDNVTLAETFFALMVAEKNLPYSFAETATEVLPKMFGDSKIAKDFSISKTKVSYIISDGIGPYLKDCFIQDIHKYGTFYSILVDETPVPEKRVQQFDILIRYFSESSKKIVTKHLESFHLGHATAEILLNCIESSTSNLPFNKLINFQSDGPNVMKSLKSKIMSHHPNLLDVGECCLHKVHNAFSEALSAFGGDIESLLVDMYYFFKRSAVQSSDFRKMQCLLDLPDHVFVRHVSSRWLTIEASLSRLIEQYEGLEKFFKSCKSRKETRLLRIQEAFNNKTTLVKVLFLKNACSLFTGFLKMFQKEDPLIHVLYDELVNVVKGIMGRFLISDSFSNKSGIELKDMDVEKSNIWRKKIEIGLDTESKVKLLSESAKKDFALGVQAFYIASVKYLLRVLPLHNKILEQMKCLHPLFLNDATSVSCIRNLAARVPNVIPTCSVSLLTDEWILLQTENLSDVYSNDNYPRIDQFWNKIFDLKRHDGKPKFENLSILVKALLSIPHGNADCERGFSINNHMIDHRSSLSIQSINGIRSIKSYTQEHGKIKDIVVSSEFLRSVKNAHKNYQSRLDKERAKTEAKELKQKMENNKIFLKEKEKALQEQLQASQKILNNAESMIQHGLKRKSFTDIQSGQILLKNSKDKISTILKELEQNRHEQNQLACKRIKT